MNFKQILTEQDWDSILAIPNYCVNEQWKCLMSILIPIFNQCFPFKSSTPKGKTKYPSTSELIDCKNTLDILLVMTRTAEGYNEVFREVKKRYNRLLVDVSKEHSKKRIDKSDNKTKCVWQIVSEIRGNPNRKKELKIPGDPNAVSNNFNNFILNAAPNLLKDLPSLEFSCKITYNEKAFSSIP
ncbi:hypothetical protein JTB14_018929 [Gonioctena quinquepunctata]|nr:hypothetical protein JTB14_018929 [Gonioctena quinquepunctata]